MEIFCGNYSLTSLTKQSACYENLSNPKTKIEGKVPNNKFFWKTVAFTIRKIQRQGKDKFE